MTRAAVSHRFEPAVTHRIAAKTAGRTLQPATPKTQPSAFSSRKQTTTTTRPAKKQQDGHGPQPPRRLAHQLRRRRRRYKGSVRPVIERVEGGAEEGRRRRGATPGRARRERPGVDGVPAVAGVRSGTAEEAEAARGRVPSFAEEVSAGARGAVRARGAASLVVGRRGRHDDERPPNPWEGQYGGSSRVLADPDARGRGGGVEQVMPRRRPGAGRGFERQWRRVGGGYWRPEATRTGKRKMRRSQGGRWREERGAGPARGAPGKGRPSAAAAPPWRSPAGRRRLRESACV